MWRRTGEFLAAIVPTCDLNATHSDLPDLARVGASHGFALGSTSGAPAVLERQLPGLR
jgi:hypothetical protein